MHCAINVFKVHKVDKKISKATKAYLVGVKSELVKENCA